MLCAQGEETNIFILENFQSRELVCVKAFSAILFLSLFPLPLIPVARIVHCAAKESGLSHEVGWEVSNLFNVLYRFAQHILLHGVQKLVSIISKANPNHFYSIFRKFRCLEKIWLWRHQSWLFWLYREFCFFLSRLSLSHCVIFQHS